MSKLLSSEQIIKTLLKSGFKFVSQRGSHQKYQKEGFTVIVPSPRKETSIMKEYIRVWIKERMVDSCEFHERVAG